MAVSENGNGSVTAKTVKELVLEHDEMLREVRDEVKFIKGGIAVTAALGMANLIAGWLLPAARATGHQ